LLKKFLLNVKIIILLLESKDSHLLILQVVKPEALPWYPDRMAYQLNLTRKDIRREELYFKLHNFLVAESGAYPHPFITVKNNIPALW
jgi:hypothetical protein